MIPRPYQETDYVNALAYTGAKLKETESDVISLLVKLTELERERDEYRQYWLDEQANRDRWIATLTEERDKNRVQLAAMREAIREAYDLMIAILDSFDSPEPKWIERTQVDTTLTKLHPYTKP